MKTNYKEIISKYFGDKTEVLCVYLFGSAASEKENIYSDVDIAVLYNDSVPPSRYSDIRINISIDLSLLLDRNVDVTVLNEAPPYLKFQVIRNGIRIYEKPNRESRTFEARSILEYFDFAPIKNMMESSLIKRIKEA